MSGEKKKEVIFKELGSLQEKVLFFLAENPENHKQGIQQGINHPPDQYGSVSKAVDALATLGFITAKNVLSQKKVKIKAYSCTDTGVLYALTRNPLADVVKLLEANQQNFNYCKPLKQLYDVWGHQYFTTYMRDVGDLLPMIQKNGIEEAMPYLLIKAAKLTRTIDKKTRQRNAKEALKLFPNSKKIIQDFQKDLSEIL